jgi:hypothetical protein
MLPEGAEREGKLGGGRERNGHGKKYETKVDLLAGLAEVGLSYRTRDRAQAVVV